MFAVEDSCGGQASVEAERDELRLADGVPVGEVALVAEHSRNLCGGVGEILGRIGRWAARCAALAAWKGGRLARMPALRDRLSGDNYFYPSATTILTD